MNTVFSTSMRKATQLTRGQNVIEATRVIQRALLGRGHARSPDEKSSESPGPIELKANFAESSGVFEQPSTRARVERADGEFTPRQGAALVAIERRELLGGPRQTLRKARGAH